MRRLHLYFFSELWRPFLASLLFLFQLLFAMYLLRGSDLLLGSAVKVGDVLGIAASLTPHFVAMAMPIAFLVAVLLGLGRLAEDRELLALSASGVAPWVLLPVPLGMALVLAALGYFLGREVEPQGMARVRDQASEILKRNLQGDIKPGVFFQDLNKLTVYAEKVDPKSYTWSNVLVHDDRDPSSPLLVLARGGRLDLEGAGVTLRLADGQLHRATANSDEYAVGRFDRADLDVGLDDAFYRRNVFRSAREELTVGELRQAVQEAEDQHRPDQAREMRVALERRGALPLAPMAFALVAVPLGARLRRGARAAGFGLTGLSFALYYILGRLGQQAGEQGNLTPFLAAQLPNLCFALLGLGLMLLTRDRA